MRARAAVCAAMYGLPDSVKIGGERYKINTDYRAWARIEKLLADGSAGGAERKRQIAAALSIAYPRLPSDAEGAVRGMVWFWSGGRADMANVERYGGAAGEKDAAKSENGGGKAKGGKEENAAGEKDAAKSENGGGKAEGGKEENAAGEKDASKSENGGGKAEGGKEENAANEQCGAAASRRTAAESDGAAASRRARRLAPLYDIDDDFEYLWGAFLSEYGIDLVGTPLHWWRFRALLMSLSEDCRFSKILAYRSMDTSKIENKEVRRHYESVKKRFSLPDRRTAEERERDTAECLEKIFF